MKELEHKLNDVNNIKKQTYNDVKYKNSLKILKNQALKILSNSYLDGKKI